MVDDTPRPVPALDAVVFAPCVEVLEDSPGSCTAVCELTDADALMPGAAAPGANPVVVEPAAGPPVNDVDAFDEAAFDEATPVEPDSQLSAIERLPMNELPDVEQGVSGRALVVVAGVLAPDIVPLWATPCEKVWAGAAADAASQMITNKPAMRCIEPSGSIDKNLP